MVHNTPRSKGKGKIKLVGGIIEPHKQKKGYTMSIELTGEETNAELKTICEENKIEVKPKRKDNPTKAELIEVIKNTGTDESGSEDTKDTVDDEIEKYEDVKPDEVPGVVLDPNGVRMMKTKSKLDEKFEDAMTMIRVVVTDHDNSVSIEDDNEGRMIEFSIGNMLTGSQRCRVPVNGIACHIPKMAIAHLESQKFAQSITGSDSQIINKMVKRYSVQRVEGWTEAEFKAFKAKQLGEK